MSCRKWVKGCGIGCGVFVVAVVVGGYALWRTSGIGRASHGLTATLEKAKKAGLPLLASDLKRNPPVKSQENAAPIFKEAYLAYSSDGELENQVDILRKGQKDIYPDPEAKQAVAKLSKLIKLAYAAAAKPHCDYDLDWDTYQYDCGVEPEEAFSANNALSVKYQSFAKDLSMILAQKGLVEAVSNHYEQSLKDLRASRQISDLISETPLIVSLLESAQCDAIIVRNYEMIIQQNAANSSKLIQVQKELLAWNRPLSLHSVIPGEFYKGLSFSRHVSGIGELLKARERIFDKQPRPKIVIKSGEPKGAVVRGLFGRLFERWLTVYEETGKNASDKKLLELIIQQDQSQSFEDKLARSLLLSETQRAVMNDLARRRCLRALVCALLYRNEHGKFPTTLIEAGFNEVDPFTDQPLKIVVDPQWCRVYSIGRDGVDDKGLTMAEMKKQGIEQVGDITAKVSIR